MIEVSWPQQGQKTGSSILQKVPVANGSGWYLKKGRSALIEISFQLYTCLSLLYYISVFPKMKALSYTSYLLKRNLNRTAASTSLVRIAVWPPLSTRDDTEPPAKRQRYIQASDHSILLSRISDLPPIQYRHLEDIINSFILALEDREAQSSK